LRIFLCDELGAGIVEMCGTRRLKRLENGSKQTRKRMRIKWVRPPILQGKHAAMRMKDVSRSSQIRSKNIFRAVSVPEARTHHSDAFCKGGSLLKNFDAFLTNRDRTAFRVLLPSL